jgi:hypothetical protein
LGLSDYSASIGIRREKLIENKPRITLIEDISSTMITKLYSGTFGDGRGKCEVV